MKKKRDGGDSAVTLYNMAILRYVVLVPISSARQLLLEIKFVEQLFLNCGHVPHSTGHCCRVGIFCSAGFLPSYFPNPRVCVDTDNSLSQTIDPTTALSYLARTL